MNYPTMFQTCKDFNQLVVPAAEYVKSERYSIPTSPERRQHHSPSPSDKPAGLRLPKPFKANLADKVPIIMQRLQKEGYS
jgi:hypothetical protein